MREAVLVLTHQEDFFVPELVLAAIAARGARALRVDTDQFPAEQSCSLLDDGGYWRTKDGEIRFGEVVAVWARRIWTAAQPSLVENRFAAACAAQARAHIDGVVAAFGPHVVVVNDRAAEQRAEHKALQLAHVRRLGLDVPRTLISNDPARVRAFIQAHAPVVTKLLSPLSATMDGSGAFVYTAVVSPEDAASVEDVRWAPQIFQQQVDKSLELRCVVVGEQVFCGATEAPSIDWRSQSHATWRPHPLAPDVARRAVELVRALGLVFAALDFVVDRHGKTWFLEVNPAGEWGFLARDASLPIADALAAALLSGRRA